MWIAKRGVFRSETISFILKLSIYSSWHRQFHPKSRVSLWNLLLPLETPSVFAVISLFWNNQFCPETSKLSTNLETFVSHFWIAKTRRVSSWIGPFFLKPSIFSFWSRQFLHPETVRWTLDAISLTVGLVSRKRPFFDWIPNRALLHSRKTAFSTHMFSTEFFDRQIQSKNFFDWICQSKNSVEKNLYLFFEAIASLIPPQKTHPHAHTHTRYHTAVSYNSVDAALAITAVASRRKSACRIPSSAYQQSVSHDSSSARYWCHFANNSCACCSFGCSRLSATPRT